MEMTERIEALETAEAARALMARYAEAIDAQDIDKFAALLDDDVVLDVGDKVEGAAAVKEFFEGAFKADPATKSHFITNVEVDWLGGGRASLKTYFLWTAADLDVSTLGWGTYDHEIVIKDGRALYSKMSLSIRRQADSRVGWATGD